MIKRIWYFGLVIVACNSGDGNREPLASGNWHAELEITNEVQLPFSFHLTLGDDTLISLRHANEIIYLNNIRFTSDSFFIPVDPFDSEIKGTITPDGQMQGQWQDYSRGNDYILRFHAWPDTIEKRNSNEAVFDAGGRWHTIFDKGKETEYNAIAQFTQAGNQITGTYLTETGDYGVLIGEADKDGFTVGRFDGGHAYLFKHQAETDSSFTGTYWSGIHSVESIFAERDDRFTLRPPDSLTFLKEGYDRFSFAFPGLDGDTVRMTDKRFLNKVMIVQIMGTWCPNCLDESIFFAELYGRYRERGLEIVALCFERTPELERSIKNVNRLRARIPGLDYTFLIAGQSDKDAASRALPMMSRIMAYPTALYIDRNGNVRKIHTAFSGPGTGEAYDNLRKETISLLEKLLDE